MFDVGGLTGTGHGSTTIARRIWQGLRTDNIRVTTADTFAASPKNAVHLDGRRVRPAEFSAAISEGFEEAYRAILAHRSDWTGEAGLLTMFRGARTRVLPRPTNQYATLGAVLGGPRYQRDGARRTAAMDILLRPFSAAVARPAVWPLLTEERRAIEGLDVPYFWAAVDGHDVVGELGPVMPRYFFVSGLESVKARINGMSETDLSRQLGVIQTVLEDSPDSRFRTPVPDAMSDGQAAPRLLAAAEWIAAELRALAIETPDGLTWSSVANPKARPSADLYGGNLGIALFFGALATVTGHRHWREVSDLAVRPVLRTIETGECWAMLEGRVGVGDGIGSVVHTLTTLGVLVDRSDLIDVATEAANRIGALLESDAHLDLLSGAAGAIVACLNLEAVRPDASLIATAQAARDHLAARAVPAAGGLCWHDARGQQLLGFAHGAAGIGFGLDRLARRTGDAVAADLARRAFRFVGAHFSASDGNWPIASTPDDERTGARASMLAWCHGAPGIALASALADSSVRGQMPDRHLELALTATARWLPGFADHLCCGTLGRADALLTGGRAHGSALAVRAAEDLTIRVVERARAAGHFRLSTPGFEYRVFEPGFFRGLSGIGYQLVRHVGPARIPSMSSFQPIGASASGSR
jgi:type 2 lantibiotic biosynthesis protein LanM